jgi:TniQ
MHGLSRLSRLPIAVAPARQETVASYLGRLAAVHGLHPREIWEQVSTRRPGTARRDVAADRLATVTGRAVQHLARALLELRDPAPDWAAWRHQSQPGCPRCDARHESGPVTRLLPHHRYVCTRHSYWIGPPDAGQPATPLGWQLADIVRAQRRHLRLVRRHGFAAAYDAVLTGFLICGHLWGDQPQTPVDAWHRWTLRAEVLIPTGSGPGEFSASRLFAAVYPEAVDIAALIASPAWRRLAAGDAEQQQRFGTEIGLRLGRPDYQPPESGDAIAHWMQFDSDRPPSKPHTLFPDTREHGSTRTVKASPQSNARQDRNAFWFRINRRGGSVLLHHRHIRPVLIRDWSPPMDGIAATIWQSQTTNGEGGSRYRSGPNR